MSYPDALDALATDKANTTEQFNDHAANHNSANDAINRIETELGLNPRGGYASVAGRLTYLQGLADAAMGPPGPPGTAPFTNVRDLDPDPDSVTDWGPIINSAYADDGIRYFVFQGYEFPFSTPIDLTNSRQVVFEGAGGLVAWGGANSGMDPAASRLVWQGTGTTPALDLTAAVGFEMRDMGFYYDNPLFTGKLIIGGAGFAIYNNFERCDLGTLNGVDQTALCIMDWDSAICCTIRKCQIGGAVWGVIGAQDNVSNANRILDTIFYGQSAAHLCNVFQQWTIDSCTFEMGSTSGGPGPTPQVIDSDLTLFTLGADIPSDFSFENNWVGDTELTEPLFKQDHHNIWRARFTGNEIVGANDSGPVMELRGGGWLTVEGNVKLATNNATGPVIDLGDVSDTANVRAFEMIRIVGNPFDTSGDASEPIINRDGHKRVELHSNPESSDTSTRVSPPRRLTDTTLPAITIDEKTALHDGTAAIYGTDLVGAIVISSGSTPPDAGTVAEITLGTPQSPDPNAASSGAHSVPFVKIWPQNIGGFTNSYYDAKPEVVMGYGPINDKFSIGFRDTFSGAVCIGYEVIQG